MIIVYKDFHKDLDRNTFLSHAILEGMNVDLVETEQWKQRCEFEFDLKINGVEHDLTKFLERLETSLDKMIENEARKIVSEKFGDLIQTLSNFEDRFEEERKRIFRDDD